MKLQLSDDTIHLTGFEGTGAGISEWRELVDAALAGGPRRVEVDLSGLRTLDARGLGALAALHRAASRHNATCLLLNPAPPVLQMLELARMDEVFRVVTAEAA